jgi:hypothetical protein
MGTTNGGTIQGASVRQLHFSATIRGAESFMADLSCERRRCGMVTFRRGATRSEMGIRTCPLTRNPLNAVRDWSLTTRGRRAKTRKVLRGQSPRLWIGGTGQ